MFGIVNEQWDSSNTNMNCPMCDKCSKECQCPQSDFFDIPPYD